MSGFLKAHIQVLGPAIKAGRKALRDLDGKEIPQPLRKVAAHSGGRLPPPLARTLLEFIDKDEWFRQKVVEAWDAADRNPPSTAVPTAGSKAGPKEGPAAATAPSEAFLVRTDAWWLLVAEAAAGAITEGADAKVAALEHQLEKAKEALDQVKRREKRLRTDADRADADVRSELERTRGALRARQAEERKDHETSASDLAMASATLVASQEAHREVEAVVAELRGRLRRARRDLAAARRRLAGGQGTAFSTDPVELARLLDHLSAAASRDHTQAAELETQPEQEIDPPAVTIPPSISPDTSAAIRWLLKQAEPFTLIVDGYNVLFLLDRDNFSTGGAREKLNDILGRLRKQASAQARVIVVYDSTLRGHRESQATGGGVEVRFASEDQIADEEVVAIAADTRGFVIVISTDREVRDEAEAAGALAFWSEALVDWVRS